MRVRCTMQYYDKEKKSYVKPGDEFDVKEDRGKQLLTASVAEEVEIKEEKKPSGK